MLARRVIPVVLYRGQEVVKGKGFDSWRSVGHVRQAVRVYQMRGVDELILLDIGATPSGDGPDFQLIRDLCSECFMPCTIGGGIRTVEHFRQALANGADKVAINTAAVENPELITAAAQKFGRQAVVVSIDVKDGEVFTGAGKNPTGLDPVRWAKECEYCGAGEIILNSVERDGTLSGYDLDLIRHVSKMVRIPVIACGGAGSYNDFALALEAGAHAVAASAMFQFTEQTPKGAARYLAERGIPVRLAA